MHSDMVLTACRNNWANGGSWSGGPPEKDNVLEIQSIEMYYNRTSIVGVNCK